MTDFHSRKILVGVFPVILQSGAMGRSVSAPGAAEFVGRFTLPFKAEWGEMLLPEGEYTLVYGNLNGGACFVEIAGKDPAKPRGIFLVEGESRASVVQNALVCVRKEGCQIIRYLELPLIGKAVCFEAPHATKPLHRQAAAGIETRPDVWPN